MWIVFVLFVAAVIFWQARRIKKKDRPDGPGEVKNVVIKEIER